MYPSGADRITAESPGTPRETHRQRLPGASLKDLLRNRSASDEPQQVFLNHSGLLPSVQKFNPNGGIDQDNRCFPVRLAGFFPELTRGLSSRISERSPCHKPLPKK